MATQTDIQAGFDAGKVGPFTGTIDNITINITAGQFFHLNLNAMNGSYIALATYVNSLISGSTHTCSCTFSATNLTYTISGSGNLTAFNLGTALANAMGFASGPLAAASSYTSTKRPYYVIRPMIPGQSGVSDDYEPPGIVKSAAADDGLSIYSISPLGVPTFNDFVLPMQRDTPLSGGGTFLGGSGHAVMTRNVTATMPWAWQDFWKHVRGHERFAWCSQTSPPSAPTADMMKMRAEAASWNPSRVTPDFGLWSPPFKTYSLGRQ